MNGDQPPQDNPALDVPAVPVLTSEQAQSQNDSDAKKEATAIASGTLEEEAAAHEHGRNEVLRDTIHRWALRVVALIASLFAVTIVVLAWHFIAPADWCWLNKEQLTTLKTIVFSGALSSAAGGYLNRRL